MLHSLRKELNSFGSTTRTTFLNLLCLVASFTFFFSSSSYSQGNQEVFIAVMQEENRQLALKKSEIIEEAADTTGSRVAILIKALKHTDSDRRRDAASELSNIGPPAKAAIPALLRALTDESEMVRFMAFNALVAMKSVSAPYLIEASTRDQNLEIRSQATHQLGLVPSNEQVVSTLLELLNDSEGSIRAWAAHSLGNATSLNEVVIDVLTEAMMDKSSFVRRKAAAALGKQVSTVSEVTRRYVIPALAEALWDSDSFVRLEAAKSLIRVSPETESVVYCELIDAFNGRSSRLSPEGALLTLSSLRELIYPVLAEIAETLVNPESPIDKKAVLEALGELKQIAQPAISAIVESVRHPDAKVRATAIWAIGEIGSVNEEGLSALTFSLRDSDAAVRARAVWVLGQCGNGAKGAIPEIRKLLDDPNENVRAIVIFVLRILANAEGERRD